MITTSSASGSVPDDSTSPTFAAQFGAPLPGQLRDRAASMSADAFRAAFAPTSGPLRLGQWQCTGDRPAHQMGTREYRATLAVADRIGTSTVAASGPIAALTAMLHERGIALEVLNFHQVPGEDGTTTFIRGTDGAGDAWAMGHAGDATLSALRAVIGCVNRLHPGRG